MTITFICGRLCSGKTSLASEMSGCKIEISSIVKELLQQSDADRSTLSKTAHLEDRIIETLKERIAVNHFYENIYITGVRQVNILQAFPDASLIWIECPEKVRLQRYLAKQDVKDGVVKSEKTFWDAEMGDENLGISKVKEYIFNR